MKGLNAMKISNAFDEINFDFTLTGSFGWILRYMYIIDDCDEFFSFSRDYRKKQIRAFKQ